MTTKLIYHTKQSVISNISPFHEAISAMRDEIWIVCPYIGIENIFNQYCTAKNGELFPTSMNGL